MKYYTKEELKNSRVFFDKTPPKFMNYFIVFISTCLILFIVSTKFIQRNSIINAFGTVTYSNAVYLSVNETGSINKVYKKEGDAVKKGDKILSIGNDKNSIEIEILNPQIKSLEKKLISLEKYEKSLNEKTNLLENSGYDQVYYGKTEYYLSIINDENYSKANLQKKKDETLSYIRKFELEKNKKMKIDIDDSSTKIAELDENIKTQQENLKQIDEQLNKPTSQVTQTYDQLISELGSDRETINKELTQLKSQEKAYNNANKKNLIIANNDGFIHYNIDTKIGLTIQQGQIIAEINDKKNNNLIVEAEINANDISKVKLNNPVKVSVNGVNQQLYGTISGRIMNISNGAYTKQTNEGSYMFYKCCVSLNKNYLIDNKDNTIQLVKDMPVQIKITYNDETYFDYIINVLKF